MIDKYTALADALDEQARLFESVLNNRILTTMTNAAAALREAASKQEQTEVELNNAEVMLTVTERERDQLRERLRKYKND